MKIAVGVMTHNPMSGLRTELVERTLKSVAKAFPSVQSLVFDNGSTDGSAHWLTEMATALGAVTYINIKDPTPANTTPGAGRLRMWKSLWPWHQEKNPEAADIVVMSDDDMEWKEGAEEKLIQVWSQAPADIAIIGGLLEPLYHWNTPRETVACGLTNVLVRDSCPGAAWSFRVPDWGIIRPHIVEDFGYDHRACLALRKDGYRVAQIDLAEHIGWGFSTHGNEADRHPDARPLDRERWQV